MNIKKKEIKLPKTTDAQNETKTEKLQRWALNARRVSQLCAYERTPPQQCCAAISANIRLSGSSTGSGSSGDGRAVHKDTGTQTRIRRHVQKHTLHLEGDTNSHPAMEKQFIKISRAAVGVVINQLARMSN